MSLHCDQLSQSWTDFRVRSDWEARTALIRHYSYLVKVTVSRLCAGRRSSIPMEDFLQVGVLALIRAVDRFEPSHEVKFETYAVVLIRVSVLELMRNEDWVPRSTREKLRTLNRAQVALEAELLRAPTDAEISERTGFSEAELGSLRALYAQSLVVRLDDFIPGDGGSTFGELVEDDSQNPRRQIEGRVIRTALAECLEKLEHREREVLRLHYFDCLTFSEIGKVIGVSESRSHQIHTRAIARLRESFLAQISVPA